LFNSQKIEQATCESLPFRYVAGGLCPDQRTIADFRQRFLPEIRELFVQILVFARTAGVLQLGEIDLNRPGVFEDTSEGRVASYERLLTLKTVLSEQIKPLLTRAAQADQEELHTDLVVEDEASFRANPRARLADARAALMACVQERRAAESQDDPPADSVITPSSPPPPSAQQAPAVKRTLYQAADEIPSGGTSDPNQTPTFQTRRKFNCRTCQVRPQCIDAKTLGPGAKLALVNMFANRTDTIGTWAKLQQDCLIVNREKQLEAMSDQQGLSRRLAKLQERDDEELEITVPALQAAALQPTPNIEHLGPQASPPQLQAYGLAFLDTERTVRLPETGQVVLGRFERGFAGSPDVDLTFEDGLVASVSRRHVCIIATQGEHLIEDLGSANGTYLNGFKLALGERARLKPGDRIILGRCRMTYNPLPEWAQAADPTQAHLSLLTITNTGQPIELTDQQVTVIGRADPSIGYTPDVDLSVVGQVAEHISRRHARVIARDGRHYLEATGSAAELKINGRTVSPDDSPHALLPGDQVWLGGCVLAYEWRLLDKESADAHAIPLSMLNRVNRHSLETQTVES
jgi:pSer/pThr/pTyr-binding forkhead associated (FHA) protein